MIINRRNAMSTQTVVDGEEERKKRRKKNWLKLIFKADDLGGRKWQKDEAETGSKKSWFRRDFDRAATPKVSVQSTGADRDGAAKTARPARANHVGS